MPALIGGIVALAVYLYLCSLAITWVVVPVTPYVMAAGMAGGLFLVLVVLIGTLLRADRFAADTVTPFQVADRLPATRTLFDRDEAWPNYLFAQGRTDLATAIGHTADRVTRMWAAMGRVVRSEPMTLLFWPLLFLPLLGAVLLTVSVVVSAVVVHGVAAVVLVVAWAGWLLAVGVLRGVDSGIRRLRRAKATCHHPGCNHRSTLPAYRCGCGVVHHDIRAGRQGLFLRRCVCGRLLPTTVLGAAAGLVAVCQRCGRDLRSGAAVLTDVVLPVFGPASAGKTRLVSAGMVELRRRLVAAGGTLTPVGPESEAALREATEIVGDRSQTAKTDAGNPPAAITVRIGTGKRRALLHLFDAAGEFFASREQNSELPFLHDAQGLIFVLDPFSVPAVASALRGALAPRLAEALPARMEPEDSYLVTVQWLRDQGVQIDRKPLAVAVVKADLLLGLPPADGLDGTSASTDIENWLRTMGLDNLIDGAERDFAEVRYHLVSSLDVGGDALSPAAPLLWLLSRSGVAPAEPASVVAP